MSDEFNNYRTSFDRLMNFSVGRESNKELEEPITFEADESEFTTDITPNDDKTEFIESEDSVDIVESREEDTNEINETSEIDSIENFDETQPEAIISSRSKDPIENTITELSRRNAKVLEQFTSWLYSTEAELVGDEEVSDLDDKADDRKDVGIFQLFEAFLAQRQELKLYVKSGRKTIETIEKSIEETSRLVEQFSRLKRERPEIERKAIKPFVMSLIEIDESLTRAVSFLETVQSRLIFHSRSIEIYAGSYCDKFTFWQRFWRRKTIFQFTEFLIKERMAEVEHILQPLQDGFKMVVFRMDDVLRRHLVTRLNPVGELVNPETMQVVAILDSDVIKPGHVVDVIRPGYLWNGRPFRSADVRAARIPEE
ncbi:MAG: nucleotide exchange factor GrpE [Planctomycetaceae bacterium]|jgi:hypothetical protein|nr:nucleotide exchange factor GrpE [Planctomycetaceae bacterium]